MEEARAHAALALEARPDFSIKTWGERLSFKNEVDLQRFLDGLRKAGLPEWMKAKVPLSVLVGAVCFRVIQNITVRKPKILCPPSPSAR
jgi:hypothetical protein